jgi:hypothetical protein
MFLLLILNIPFILAVVDGFRPSLCYGWIARILNKVEAYGFELFFFDVSGMFGRLIFIVFAPIVDLFCVIIGVSSVCFCFFHNITSIALLFLVGWGFFWFFCWGLCNNAHELVEFCYLV